MPALPTLPTIAGGIVTTSELSQIVSALSFLLTPPTALVRQSAVQSIPNSAWTALTFELTDWDSATGHSNVTNNTRYTAQYAGKYWISGLVSFATNATGARGIQVYINGTVSNPAATLLPGMAGNSSNIPLASTPVSLAVGDYVELRVFQGSGGALNTAAGSFMGVTFESE